MDGIKELFQYNEEELIQQTYPKSDEIGYIPCHIINVDSQTERYEYTLKNVSDNGFTDIRRFSAITPDSLDNYKEKYPKNLSTEVESYQKYPERLALYLSNLEIMEEMIKNKTPYWIVFEDDVYFHPKFKSWFPLIIDKITMNYDIMFLGHKTTGKWEQTPTPNLMLPCHHAHAILWTYNGAVKLRKYLTSITTIRNWWDNALTKLQLHMMDRPKEGIWNYRYNFSWVLINLKSIMGDGRNAVKLRYDYLESDGMVYQDRDNFSTQLREGEMW